MMYYPIPEASNSIPIYLLVTFFKIVGKTISRFPNDFKIPDNRINGFIVIKKLVVAQPLNVVKDFFTTFDNIIQ